jgi:type IV pilus assembly protein PilB
LLRQDPDTVLVGEIRDYETAEVAIQAALTGHLVLSTLHTNDAPSTITRLMNMGIEPFLVVSSLNTVVAQRLLRRICSKCVADTPVPRERLIEMGMSSELAAAARIRQGKGCPACGGSGYKGRVAIYEVLDFSATLKEMVLAGQSVLDLRKQAVKEGMKTLRMSGLTKVAEGMTTLEEALSLTMEN